MDQDQQSQSWRERIDTWAERWRKGWDAQNTDKESHADREEDREGEREPRIDLPRGIDSGRADGRRDPNHYELMAWTKAYRDSDDSRDQAAAEQLQDMAAKAVELASRADDAVREGRDDEARRLYTESMEQWRRIDAAVRTYETERHRETESREHGAPKAATPAQANEMTREELIYAMREIREKAQTPDEYRSGNAMYTHLQREEIARTRAAEFREDGNHQAAAEMEERARQERRIVQDLIESQSRITRTTPREQNDRDTVRAGEVARAARELATEAKQRGEHERAQSLQRGAERLRDADISEAVATPERREEARKELAEAKEALTRQPEVAERAESVRQRETTDRTLVAMRYFAERARAQGNEKTAAELERRAQPIATNQHLAAEARAGGDRDKAARLERSAATQAQQLRADAPAIAQRVDRERGRAVAPEAAKAAREWGRTAATKGSADKAKAAEKSASKGDKSSDKGDKGGPSR